MNTCVVIIEDDFNNVFICCKKAKKKDPEVWELFKRDLKGKETPEKCINKLINDDLKAIIFDLELFKEYNTEEGVIGVYTGSLKEKAIPHKSISNWCWIGSGDIEKYDFKDLDKVILKDYFNK